ncbi:hypothetical protein H3N56_11480 [Cetobacterium sp. 2A]|uniref:hypothetical protein n=1 Tax=Cetobacterium sp. 2A TaxID=2754723 RepID=UPI00163CA6B8|nr:hypothetical protein [Cetobacterium sp. 2A]MBC2857053.1 hypothetical protein [Cetobacterium sp. 2A]
MQFYINFITQEIHTENCNYNSPVNQIFLGTFDCPLPAITVAKNTGYSYTQVCEYCCSHMLNKVAEEEE